MAFQKDSDWEPNRCCMLERESPQNPPRRCEHVFCSQSVLQCCILSVLLSHPLLSSLPRLPVSGLIIDYTAKAVIVFPCVWCVVWLKTKLMGSTSNADGRPAGWPVSPFWPQLIESWPVKMLIYNPKRTQTLPLADIMHMSEGVGLRARAGS